MSRISELAMHFLVNAAWQIAAIAVGAAVCARLLRSLPSRFRHALWGAALVLSLALPVWGLFDFQKDAALDVGELSAARQPPENVTSTPNAVAAPVASRAETRSLRLEDLLQTRRRSVATSSTLALTLAIALALFAVYRVGRLCRALLKTRDFRRSAFARELPTPLAEMAARCQKAFDLKHIPILFSTKATTPATVGAWRPVIILPESFYAETAEETLATMLGHEMAHVARRDFAFNLAYEFLCLPIAFHPLANLVKRQIDRTRELACDDLVTEKILERAAYARSLVRIAGALVSPADQALTLGVFDADILEERIMKLTKSTRRLGARSARLVALGAFSLLCVTCVAVSTFSFDLQLDGTYERGNGITANEPQNETFAEGQHRGGADSGAQAPGRTAVMRAELTQNSASAQARAEAACSAGKDHSVEAIPMLVAMLGDDTPIEFLRCWEGGRWSPALESFKQPSPGEQAAIALASMGSAALEPLTGALNDANSSIRRNAAWAIGELTKMGEDERASAVPRLIELLVDGDEWVRMAAARALGEIRDDRSVEALIARLSDGQWQVRKLAAWALGEMRDTSAVDALCSLLQTDSRSEVRVTTAWALGEMQDRRAVKALCSALVSDQETEVRATTAWALGEIQSRKAVSFLKQALSDPEERVREKAKYALAEIEDTDG